MYTLGLIAFILAVIVIILIVSVARLSYDVRRLRREIAMLEGGYRENEVPEEDKESDSFGH